MNAHVDLSVCMYVDAYMFVVRVCVFVACVSFTEQSDTHVHAHKTKACVMGVDEITDVIGVEFSAVWDH